MRHSYTASIIVAIALAACATPPQHMSGGGEGGIIFHDGTGGTGGGGCIPGLSTTCPCGDGGLGGKVCGPDGTYGACTGCVFPVGCTLIRTLTKCEAYHYCETDPAFQCAPCPCQSDPSVQCTCCSGPQWPEGTLLMSGCGFEHYPWPHGYAPYTPAPGLWCALPTGVGFDNCPPVGTVCTPSGC